MTTKNTHTQDEKLMAAWGLYGVIAAIQTWTGKEFKYAVIGNIVEQSFNDTAV